MVWLSCLLIPSSSSQRRIPSLCQGHRERVGVKGDSWGMLSGRWREEEREARQGELATEGGKGASVEWGGGARVWDSFSSHWQTLQLSQHTPSGARFPWFLSACSGKFPKVRSSEQAIGTYPHNRFHDQTPCEHTWLIHLQRPIISVCLSDPQSAVTELTLPPASRRHPQTYRCDLLANPFLTS